MYLFHPPKKIESTECCHWKVVLSISALELKLHLKEFIWLICSRSITFHQLGHIHTFSSVWSSVFDSHQLLWEICAASAANCTSVQQLFNQKGFFFSFCQRPAALNELRPQLDVSAGASFWPTGMTPHPWSSRLLLFPAAVSQLSLDIYALASDLCACVWDTDTTVTYRSCGVNIS